MQATDRNNYMQEAIAAARHAAAQGEVPVGAVLVDAATGAVIAVAGNTTEQDHDPAGHAEIKVLQAGGRHYKSPRLTGCDLYVTLEPCPMCAAAIAAARIRRVYFGAYDPKSGGVEHGPRIFDHATCHHKPDVYGGIAEQTCADLLRAFFKDRRGA